MRNCKMQPAGPVRTLTLKYNVLPSTNTCVGLGDLKGSTLCSACTAQEAYVWGCVVLDLGFVSQED